MLVVDVDSDFLHSKYRPMTAVRMAGASTSDSVTCMLIDGNFVIASFDQLNIENGQLLKINSAGEKIC